jgi:hypothetical protein
MGMLVGAVLVGAGVVVDEHATTPIAMRATVDPSAIRRAGPVM